MATTAYTMCICRLALAFDKMSYFFPQEPNIMPLFKGTKIKMAAFDMVHLKNSIINRDI